ncbi:MAG: hypothetical protein PHH40_00610 [Candidatus Moranbacteria bacterium]|nr:hypothetical protein [Candidatus Moranbacteria bacterium]MDD3964814.1 hypothetical protein [Candidatus Moranbacteria bacterium]
MKEKNTKKIGTGAALLIAVMSFSSFFAVASLVGKNQSPLTPVSLASDNEGEDGNDSDENKDEEDDDKDEVKSASEKAKKEKEKSREDLKKRSERAKESNKQTTEQDSDDEEDNNDENEGDENDENDDNDGDVDDDMDEEDDDSYGQARGGDFEGMYKDSAKTLSKLQENIAEAEKHILEKQAEGVDVTTALAELSLAKAKLAGVSTAFTASNFEMAKKLSKEIKKESLFSEKDLEFKKDMTESIAEVMKKFTKVEKKIASLVALGGDSTTFNTQLASLRADFDVLQTSSLVTRTDARAFEKKAERLKNLVEQSIFALGGTEEDDDLYADHEEDADDLDEDLNDVAEIEDGDDNGVAKKVRAIAAEHRSSVADIAKSLSDIQNQSGFTKTVFGPDATALNGLTAQTTAMTARADALTTASTQVTDPDVKQILTDRASALRSEASKLQAYLTATTNQFSIFGKFLSLFR